MAAAEYQLRALKELVFDDVQVRRIDSKDSKEITIKLTPFDKDDPSMELGVDDLAC